MLSLIKYLPEDFMDYCNLVGNDDVMRYITGKGMAVSEAKEKFTSILEINDEENMLGYFKVVDDALGWVGECKLVRYKYDRSLLEIGYLLKQEFWKQGLGTQICEILLQRAIAVAPHHPVIGVIDPENTASKRLLEKFGFESYFSGIEDGVPIEKLILRR